MTEICYKKSTLSTSETAFIAAFMRLEFALKEAGYCNNAGRASVDWPRVAKALGDQFYAEAKTTGAASLLMHKPPKKQIARDGVLDWAPRKPPSNTDDLLVAVRAVRNNLLHGGKSGDADADPGDPKRNAMLIAEARQVIELMLHRLENVRTYFEGRY